MFIKWGLFLHTSKIAQRHTLAQPQRQGDGRLGDGNVLKDNVLDLIARLVRKQPEMAVQAAEILGLGMVVFGGYRILNALIAEAEKEEKACEKQPEEHR